LRTRYFVPHFGPISERERRFDQGDLARGSLQLVSPDASRRARRRVLAVPRLLSLVGRRARLEVRLAERAEEVGRPPPGSHATRSRRRGRDLPAGGAQSRLKPVSDEIEPRGRKEVRIAKCSLKPPSPATR